MFSKHSMFVVVLLFAGCKGSFSVDETPDRHDKEKEEEKNNTLNNTLKETPNTCLNEEGFFSEEVWPKVGDTSCITCHSAEGSASASNFILEASSTKGFLHQNYLAFSKQAKKKKKGSSILELKAIKAVPHEGGEAIKKGGNQHDVLKEFISRVDGVSKCDPNPEEELDVPYYKDVVFVSDVELLRRITLNLGGRLPTESEISKVEKEGLDGLDPIMDEVMKEPAFEHRLKEAFQDILLTAGFEDSVSDVLFYNYYQPFQVWRDAYGESDERNKIEDELSTGLMEEPVELIAHVVRNDLSFKEILTADYMMVTPYSAKSWGVFDAIKDQFQNPEDYSEFIKTRLPSLHYWENSTDLAFPDNMSGYYPHAGLLGSFQFLHRHRNTDTNRNRHRARVYFKTFLGVDLMELAPAVTDSAAVAAMFSNPVKESPDCSVCHNVMDPVAGLFRNYANNGSPETIEVDGTYKMLPPGYNESILISESEQWRSLQWLAEKTVEDKRFAPTMVEHAYYLLTQATVMRPPADTEDPLFKYRRNGYDAQREMINDATTTFSKNSFNFKSAIKALAKSKFFRARAVGQTDDIRREAELEALGLSALLTPEQIERKLNAIFGTPWQRMEISRNYDRGEFYMLYGGINYIEIVERFKEPNGIMGSIMRIMSNQLACKFVSKHLSEPNGLLAPVVADANEATIRKTLVDLHWRFLGQYKLDAHGAEINRSFSLFNTVLTEGQTRLKKGEEAQELPNLCGDYADDFESDPNYIKRAWQSIYIYLLRHPQFLLQ